MFGQNPSYQTCDELEVRRLLSSGGTNTDLGGTDAHARNQRMNNSMHYSSGQSQGRSYTRKSSGSHNSDRSSSGSHHHQTHTTSADRMFSSGFNHQVNMYSNSTIQTPAPAPAHTQAVAGFSPSQRLSFIPPHILQNHLGLGGSGNKQTHQMSTPQHQAQQQQFFALQPTSVVRANPQSSSKSGRNEQQQQMPSMPNLFAPTPMYTIDSFVNYNTGAGAGFFQQQEERTPANTSSPSSSLRVETEVSEEEEQQIEDDSRDQDYEEEEDEVDEDEFEGAEQDPEDESEASVSAPYNCGLCQKMYKRKSNYLAHLKKSHDRNARGMGRSQEPVVMNRIYTPSIPASTSPRATQQQQMEEIIKSGKCPYCRKMFKTERNFRKHLERHETDSKIDVQSELDRAISSLTSITSTIPAPPTPMYVRTPSNLSIPNPNPHPAPLLQLFKCNWCPELLQDKDKLRNHQINQHNASCCVDCGELVAESEFFQHKKKHLIEPCKWKCAKCPTLIFDVYKSFKEHLQTHTVEPYKEPSQEFLTRKAATVELVPPAPEVPTTPTTPAPAEGTATPSTSSSSSTPIHGRSSGTLRTVLRTTAAAVEAAAAAAATEPTRIQPSRRSVRTIDSDDDDEIKAPVYIKPSSSPKKRWVDDDDDDDIIVVGEAIVNKPRPPPQKKLTAAKAIRILPTPKVVPAAKTPSKRPARSTNSRFKRVISPDDDDPPYNPKKKKGGATATPKATKTRGRGKRAPAEPVAGPSKPNTSTILTIPNENADQSDYEVEFVDLEPDEGAGSSPAMVTPTATPSNNLDNDNKVPSPTIAANEDGDGAGDDQMDMDDDGAYQDDPLGGDDFDDDYERDPIDLNNDRDQDVGDTTENTGEGPSSTMTKPQLPPFQPCIICDVNCQNNRVLREHILAEHCPYELRVEVLVLEKELEKLGGVEFIEVGDDEDR